MSLAYFTIQFVSDPMRAEGRNVAVIGTADGRGHVRAVGLTAEGRLDMAEFRAVADLSVPESMAYPDWIDYFHCVAADDAKTPETLAQELRTLAASSGPFVVGTEGTADIGAQESPETVMDRIFDRMVGRPPAEHVDRFPERLEHVLYTLELRALPDFHQDAEIELETATSSVLKLRFDLALVEPPAVAFRIVRYGDDNRRAARDLRAAVAEFRRAWEIRFLSAGRSVVLTDRDWPASVADPITQTRVALINIFADDAVQRLRTVLQRRRHQR